MTDKVVDTSALAAVCYEEESAAEIVERLEGHTLHGPHLLRYEMANTCLKKIRRAPERTNLLVSQHEASLDIEVQTHPVDPAEVVSLALRFRLSAYDASFLWLANILNVELITLDARLLTAFRSL